MTHVVSQSDTPKAMEVEAATPLDYSVPIVDWSDSNSDAIDEALQAFRAAVEELIHEKNAEARARHADELAQGYQHTLELVSPFCDSLFARLRALMAADSCCLQGMPAHFRGVRIQDALNQFAVAPGVTPVALMKMCIFFAGAHRDNEIASMTEGAFNAMHAASGQPSLLELQQLLGARGYGPEALLKSYCQGWRYGHGDSPLGRDWAPLAVWPFFVHHVELLNEQLAAVAGGRYNVVRSYLYRAVALFPQLPPSTVDVLFDLALGSVKGERVAAQNALIGFSGTPARIVSALASGKGDVRTAAAQWLTRTEYKDALPALEEAVAKEKNDAAKGAMLDALNQFGQPMEKYFDRKLLAREATAALAKGVPKDLAWFPWAAMPALHWADTAVAVEPDVLRLLLVQAFKQKSPEPNAVLRKLCGMFAAQGRERFGQFVLEAWITQDTMPIPREEAEQAAMSHAQGVYNMLCSRPRHFPGHPQLGCSVDQIYAGYLPRYLVKPVGSAFASRGVLAVAGAFAGARAARVAERYLKTHFGTRAGQGKALIAMLAWIAHPAATQLVLSVGNRFRTRSFQEEATRQAEALAERKGWTLAELADRTMPAAGFDAAGELELDFGARSFVARLLPEFKIALFTADGKKLHALPPAREDDDPELAKTARQDFQRAKKDIKDIAKMQTARLYEALCIERDWSFDDWNRHLMGHPVVRHLAQRVVWVQSDKRRSVSSFRPLDDGTLTDCDDNQVTFAVEARVRIAHDGNLDSTTGEAWIQHMLDYKIVALFQQFGKGADVLPAASGKQVEIDDFEGCMLDAFVLRSRALQLGYVRGPAEEGACFTRYEKRFTAGGLVARLAFTGNLLPETNRKVALLATSFYYAGVEEGRGRCELARLPAVMVSECFSDIRMIAEAGDGFDPDWKQKTGYSWQA